MKFTFTVLLFGVSLSVLAQDNIYFDLQKNNRSYVDSFMRTLEEHGVNSQQKLKWIFEFTGRDSISLSSTLSYYSYSQNEVSYDTIYLASSHDNTKSRVIEGGYIAEISEYKEYGVESLTKRLNTLKKIFKKTSIEFLGLGVELLHELKPQTETASTKEDIISPNFVIKGIIREKESEAAISYVNIGIEGKNIGTISGSDGTFILKLSEKLDVLDSLTFSCIGYQQLRITLSSLLENKFNTILLNEKATILNELLVESENLSKKITLGSKKPSNQTGFIHGTGAGAEAAKRIDPKSKEVYLLNSSIHIRNETGKPFKFLVNIYDEDPVLMLPNRNVVKKAIVVESSIKDGWVTVNLSDQGLIFDKPFYISFQWTDENTRNPLISIKNTKAYTRPVSLGDWIGTKDFGWVIKTEVSIMK